jgi:hypothetical protein
MINRTCRFFALKAAFRRNSWRRTCRFAPVLLVLLMLAGCSPGGGTEGTTGTTRTTTAAKTTRTTTGLTTTAGSSSGGLTSLEAVALVWPRAQKAFGDAVLYRMAPVNDKKSTVPQLDSRWLENDRAAAWFIWYADPAGENWMMYTIEGQKIAKVDIGTRGFTPINMPAEWPRGDLKVSMKQAAAKAAAQGADPATAFWVEFNCDYPASDTRNRPVWVFQCAAKTKSGGVTNYQVLVDAITGEIVVALDEQKQKMTLPIDLKALSEAKVANHQGDLLDFFACIDEGDADGAVKRLSTALVPDSATGKAWLAGFQSLKSVKVVKAEQVRNEEWTDQFEAYKVTLDVSTSEPPEKYGWDNGQNTRWITLVPQGTGAWKVDSLQTSP